MKFLSILGAVLAAVTICADTIPFRSGTVFAAELSTRKPAFDNFSEAGLLKNNPNPIYAAVVIKLHPKRKLSVCDYTLETMGISFDCVAIRSNDGNFDMDTTVKNADPYTKYTLLFLLDSQWAKPNAVNEFTLRSIAGPENRSTTLLPFTHKRDQEFTRPSQIPANGAMPKAKK